MQQDGMPQAGVHIGICCYNTQEGGHVGMDHAAPLGYAPYPHLLPLNVNLDTASMQHVTVTRLHGLVFGGGGGGGGGGGRGATRRVAELHL